MAHDTGPIDGGERTRDKPGRALRIAPETADARLVLIVSSDTEIVGRVSDTLAASGIVAASVANRREAIRACEKTWFDLVIVDTSLARGAAFGICEAIARGEHAARVMMLGAGAKHAVKAMRSGANDVVDPSDAKELTERIEAAMRPQRDATEASQRDARLRSLANKLHTSREAFSGQVSRLCEDLLGAYTGLSEQLDDVAMASELNGLLRQELDVESLLRTQLEFLLARLGSTNAGVFLPSQSGDYSLGAYINYDVPRESAEVMLDHLADTVAPAFEDARRVRVIDQNDELEALLGEDAHWLSDRSVMVVACHDEAEDGDEPECLAVIVLFRKRRVGFTEQATRSLQIASDLFAQQLGRVIRIHHRHIPKDQWGVEGEDDLMGL